MIITSTEASRHFSDLLNRVHYQGQSFDIKRGKEVIAKLVPVKQQMSGEKFANFLKNLPILDEEDQQDFEAIVKECRTDMHRIRDPWG